MPLQQIFADTFYWIALVDPRDAFHAQVAAFSSTIGLVHVVTTDEVFAEVLAFLSRSGAIWRSKAATMVHQMRNDFDVTVLPQTRSDFDAALALYESRLDKSYSLTECRSMLAMRGQGISEALTNDHHFTQEGFTIQFP